MRLTLIVVIGSISTYSKPNGIGSIVSALIL